eukprot:2595067-Pleurochrysis_carterae.AAC.1
MNTRGLMDIKISFSLFKREDPRRTGRSRWRHRRKGPSSRSARAAAQRNLRRYRQLLRRGPIGSSG